MAERFENRSRTFDIGGALAIPLPGTRPRDGVRRRRRRRLGPRQRIPYSTPLGPVVVLLLWVALSATGTLDPRIIPAPWTVADTAWDLWFHGKLRRTSSAPSTGRCEASPSVSRSVSGSRSPRA